MEKLDRMIERTVKVLMWMACFMGFLMMVHVTLDVTGRVVFNQPILGTIEFASHYYMVSVAYLPLAYVSMTDGQIMVELFTRNMRPERIRRIDTTVHVITAVYMVLFAVFTAEHAIEQTILGEIAEMADEFIDIWPSRWLLPIAFVVMAAYLLAKALRDFRNGDGTETHGGGAAA